MNKEGAAAGDVGIGILAIAARHARTLLPQAEATAVRHQASSETLTQPTCRPPHHSWNPCQRLRIYGQAVQHVYTRLTHIMASWFGAGTSAMDEQVERATSSSLEDIALNLEITDLIRSKTIPPKEAMRSLKRRIGNKNPNIQLAALSLTDTCVKNGGEHFIQEIASREFMDNLVSFLNTPLNDEVKTRILDLIQSWATAATGRSSLGYIDETYRSLQREGFRFPPKTEVAATMFDSSAPPEWTDSDVCMRCRERFTFTNRKHHCRNCGNVFCGQCSAKSIPLPHLGILQPVRVDDGCYARLTEKSRTTPLPTHINAMKPPTGARMQARDPRVAEDSFDADLKRALEMSLEESKGHSGAGYVPQSQMATPKPLQKAPTPKKEEEDDPELAAAIAASLADMEEQKKKHAASFKQQQQRSSTPSVYAPKTNNELTAVEAENINLFATLVDRLQHQPPGAILREPQLQELYESIGALRPKLARTYGETMSKHDTLLDIHSKMATVVRYYDRMLEERLSNTYNQSRYGAPRPQSGMYPSLSAGIGAPPSAPMGGVESYYNSSAPAMESHAYNQSPYPSFNQHQQYAQQGYPQQAPPEAAYQQQYSQYPPQVQPQQQPPSTPQQQHQQQYAQPPQQYAPPQQQNPLLQQLGLHNSSLHPDPPIRLYPPMSTEIKRLFPALSTFFQIDFCNH
ncbi:ubiquitin binding protein [Aureobasidium pullulans]|uniref:Vacuolar protein sorting-associated protein 27 n=1 Tax=Aureobasidium pullulans TaxID=5580 RepID=A0A4S8ZFP1_AURPU|nr:ubiquitin binding protein [Aureobasidium pullulans]